MAKHFKTQTSEDTVQMKAPYESDNKKRKLSGTTNVSLPYGQAATYHYSYPSAAVRGDELFVEDVPARGGIHMVGRGFALLLAWLLRLVAIALFVLVVLNVLSISVLEVPLERVTDALSSFLPWHEAVPLSVDTPFGGSFRGDLALLSLFFFVLDWLMYRLRATLR
jgi:hypothetical protein